MLFEIVHAMTFSYAPPVFLEPITVRLRPRCDCTQGLQRHAIAVTPTPAGGCQGIDLDGNTFGTYWFEGSHSSLEITATSRVETLRTDPFDFLLTDPKTSNLPLAYPPDLEPLLEPYLRRDECAPEVDAFARDVRREANDATLPFLSLLAGRLSTLCEHEVREQGDAFLPAQTLVAPRAACRDLAVLAMDVCRSAGLAARFVSGYQQGDEEQPSQDLHAWLEVYLPGAGWRGYDPTSGLAVADRHVALCAAANPRHASPTFGTFRRTGAASRLDCRLSITTRSG